MLKKIELETITLFNKHAKRSLQEVNTHLMNLQMFNDALEEYKSNQVQAAVKPEIAKETENILLSELIGHLRTDFDDGEVISYRIKVKQPFSTREIRYPSK